MMHRYSHLSPLRVTALLSVSLSGTKKTSRPNRDDLEARFGGHLRRPAQQPGLHIVDVAAAAEQPDDRGDEEGGGDEADGPRDGGGVRVGARQGEEPARAALLARLCDMGGVPVDQVRHAPGMFGTSDIKFTKFRSTILPSFGLFAESHF